MGIDFGELFDQAGEKAKAALDDIVKVGKPALEASLEQWGIDTLTRMQKESQGELNEAIKEVTKNDPAPGSFGAALSTTVQNSFLQNYGHFVLMGVAGIIVLVIFLKGK